MPLRGPLNDYKIATLLGKWPFTFPWLKPCIESWSLLQGSNESVSIISDGSLLPGDIENSGIHFKADFNPDGEQVIREYLSAYPTLQRLRAGNMIWRKILDLTILNASHRRVLLIDTDVIVRRPAFLPDLGSMVYLREDLPSYHGRPDMAWRVPLVRSLNAGFILFEPACVDFDFLEWLARTFFRNLKNPWLVEQTSWAALAGRQTERYYFAGTDARTLSGFTTRSSEDMDRDVVKPINSRTFTTREEFAKHPGSATVLHVAGLSKRHWDVLVEDVPRLSQEPVTLRAIPDGNIGFGWRCAITARLILKTFKP